MISVEGETREPHVIEMVVVEIGIGVLATPLR
jgi:hypothetical protein